MKSNTNIIFFSILVFHVVWCFYSFYTLFGQDFDVWTTSHYRPFLLLVFTLVWLGVCLKKTFFGFAYIGVVMVEFLSQSVLRNTNWAELMTDLFFPIDLIFVAILLFLFKPHFGILQRPNAVSDKLRSDA